MKIALITGSGGLIGSQASRFFHSQGFYIVGIDNNMRQYFFGESGSVNDSIRTLESDLVNYEHYSIDIRDYSNLEKLFAKYNSDIKILIHTAAQPSHDWASKEPLTDFGVNATGTMNLLELTRQYCFDATFIFTSTNKVYGDRPNLSFTKKSPDTSYKNMMISELDMRYEAYFDNSSLASIDETMSIDNSKHSIFGASKIAADIMCQEFGKYFGMNIGIFRGGCLTGPNHSGTELHGFLSYLVKSICRNTHYTIYGYKGKQVRDNIHAQDLVTMFWHFHNNPKKGEVYNVGGGRQNSTSILEAISMTNQLIGKNWDKYKIVDNNRSGDHIWYITDFSKFSSDYPDWKITISLEETLKQIANRFM